jgi:hypothetical protein
MIRIILDDKLFTSPLGDKVDVRLNNSDEIPYTWSDSCSECSEFSMLVAAQDSGPCECLSYSTPKEDGSQLELMLSYSVFSQDSNGG